MLGLTQTILNQVSAHQVAFESNGGALDFIGTTFAGAAGNQFTIVKNPARNAAVGNSFTRDQRGFAITDGKPDIGAYEAGDVSNFNAWIYENLPASTAATALVHRAFFDCDGDGVSIKMNGSHRQIQTIRRATCTSRKSPAPGTILA